VQLRLLISAVTALLYASSAFAQTFEPGLLVRANGDTLRGEIENGFWVEPPAFIRFRPTPASPGQSFEPRQLRAVSFTAGRYFRYEALPVNHAAEVTLNRLPHGYFTDIQIDSLLTDVLLEGPTTLFRVVRGSTVHYFIRRPGQPYLEISDRKFLRQTDPGAWVVMDGNNYRADLERYFGDCPAALTAAAKAPFTAPGVAAVVRAYNDACAPAPQPTRSWLDQTRPRRRTAFQGGVLVGGRYNRIEGTDGTCIDCQTHPFGGLYGELFQPSRTFAVYGELSLSPLQGQESVVNAILTSTTVNGVTVYSYQNVYDHFNYRAVLGTARLGLRYFSHLPHEQQLFLGFGFELNNVLSIRQTAGPQVRLDASIEHYGFPTLLPNLALGWRAQRFTLSLDGQLYRNPNSPNLAGIFFSSNYAARLGLSYRLGRNPDVAKASPISQP